jgi:hypothetical protein
MKFNEAEENNWINSYFDRLLELGSAAEQEKYAFEHPLLLSLGVIQYLNGQRGNESEIAKSINHLDQIRKYYWDRIGEYPIGTGPLEKIIDKVKDGSLDYNNAIEMARRPECSGLLSPVYVKAIMHSMVEELDFDIKSVIQAAELVVESVIAMPLDTYSMHVMMQASEGYINLAHGSLLRRPDGKVYARAINFGQWSGKVAEDSGNPLLKGEFLHNIGTLSLDAYAANFGPNEDFKDNIDVWLGRANNPMPSAEEGLKNARILLTMAAELREPGPELGRTLKALLETVVYESFLLDRAPDINYLSSLANEALKHLDEQVDALHINRVKDLMSIYV